MKKMKKIKKKKKDVELVNKENANIFNFEK
jgi:hypothetical protein